MNALHPLNVLSLFNGISCGRIALERAGIPVANYYESEIDKYAGIVSAYNWPNSVQIGDVRNVVISELPFIPDLLIAGSPCQGFSFAGKQLNFNDPRSALFFEFVRILKECQALNPNVLFLLENVPMKKEFQRVINEHLGVYPVVINGSLVSAQNRERLFWSNIRTKTVGLFGEVHTDIPQPQDKGILLTDILESDVDEKYFLSDKALARIVRNTYSKAKVNPDKTGTINTKNNSGQLSIDSGTTLIGVVNDNGNLREVLQANCIDASYAKGIDNHGQRTLAVVVEKVDVNGKVKGRQDKASCFTAGANTAGNHSQMDLIVQRPRGNNTGGERAINGKTASVTSNSWEHNNHVIVHNMMGRTDTSGNGGHGHLSKQDGKSYCHDCSNPNAIEIQSVAIRGRYTTDGNMEQRIEPNKTEKSNCVTGSKKTAMLQQYNRIRRLTPTEVCRLFNVPDSYFHDSNGKRLVSESQQYKALGNGWVVDVIAHIFSFIKQPNA